MKSVIWVGFSAFSITAEQYTLYYVIKLCFFFHKTENTAEGYSSPKLIASISNDAVN